VGIEIHCENSVQGSWVGIWSKQSEQQALLGTVRSELEVRTGTNRYSPGLKTMAVMANEGHEGQQM